MDEVTPYETLLSVYINQESTLTEKSEELKQLSAKYQETMQTMNKLRKERDSNHLMLNQNKVQIMDRLDSILKTCKGNGLSWKEIESKQSGIRSYQEKVKSANQQKLDVVQDFVKNRKQLDIEISTENLISKIQEYYNKCESDQNFIIQAKNEIEDVCKCATMASEYEISDLMKSYRINVDSRKNFATLNAKIEETKAQVQTIMLQIKELNGSS